MYFESRKRLDPDPTPVYIIFLTDIYIQFFAQICPQPARVFEYWES